jgi:hypothetical protein
MVVNIVDVGWATSKSGCLPITVSPIPPFSKIENKAKAGRPQNTTPIISIRVS